MRVRLLAVIRKRMFLTFAGQGRDGFAQFEAQLVEITFRCRMGAKFVDDGPEIGQRADRGESGRICSVNRPYRLFSIAGVALFGP